MSDLKEAMDSKYTLSEKGEKGDKGEPGQRGPSGADVSVTKHLRGLK